MSFVTGSDVPRPTGPSVRLTYDDLVHFPDDGKRHELIDGEHYVTPSPNLKHHTATARTRITARRDLRRALKPRIRSSLKP